MPPSPHSTPVLLSLHSRPSPSNHRLDLLHPCSRASPISTQERDATSAYTINGTAGSAGCCNRYSRHSRRQGQQVQQAQTVRAHHAQRSPRKHDSASAGTAGAPTRLQRAQLVVQQAHPAQPVGRAQLAQSRSRHRGTEGMDTCHTMAHGHVTPCRAPICTAGILCKHSLRRSQWPFWANAGQPADAVSRGRAAPEPGAVSGGGSNKRPLTPATDEDAGLTAGGVTPYATHESSPPCPRPSWHLRRPRRPGPRQRRGRHRPQPAGRATSRSAICADSRAVVKQI